MINNQEKEKKEDKGELKRRFDNIDDIWWQSSTARYFEPEKFYEILDDAKKDLKPFVWVEEDLSYARCYKKDLMELFIKIEKWFGTIESESEGEKK